MTEAVLRRGCERGFVLGGDAVFTLENTRTGGRYTYKVVHSGDKKTSTRLPVWFVSVLTGPANEQDYSYIGIVSSTGAEFFWTGKSHLARDAVSVLAFGWFWRHVDALPTEVRVWHSGHCSRCGRTLTTPESVETGIGPVCATRAA